MPGAKVIVDLEGRPSWSVRVGTSLIDVFGEDVRAAGVRCNHAIIIADELAAPLYCNRLKGMLAREGFKALDISVSANGAQTIEAANELWQAFSDTGFADDALVIGLGDRAVCALAAFSAALYGGGMPYAALPTTLAAMAASTVADAAAIGVRGKEDALRARFAPVYACASLDVLADLPAVQWREGCVEVVKAALAGEDEAFFWLTENADALAARDATVTATALARTIAARADLIGAIEEKAAFAARTLCPAPAAFSYGDTFARAMRAVAGASFNCAERAGEGMRFAIRLGAALAGTPVDLVREQDALLDILGMPQTTFDGNPDALLNAMANAGQDGTGSILFSVPRDVGDFTMMPVAPDIIREHLAARSAMLER